MWVTQPYVEEISVGSWPFLDFLTPDNGTRNSAMCTQTHRQMSHLPHSHLFSMKLRRMIKKKILINWTFCAPKTFPCIRARPNICKHAPRHLAHFFALPTPDAPHREVSAIWCSALSNSHLIIPHCSQKPIKKESNLLTAPETHKKSEGNADTKRQENKQNNEGKAPESETSAGEDKDTGGKDVQSERETKTNEPTSRLPVFGFDIYDRYNSG